MLVWLLNFIFDILRILFQIVPWVLAMYCILRLIMPQNKYVLLVGKYLEVVLAPIRRWLQKVLPQLSNTGFDFSLVALWLCSVLAGWLVQLLRNVLL